MLAPLGYVTLVVAVAADMGISLLVTLNGLRLLRGAEGRSAAACDDACCSAAIAEAGAASVTGQ